MGAFPVPAECLGKDAAIPVLAADELEGPVGNIALADGELGAVFRKGLAQVSHWETWLQANYSGFGETFEKHRRDADPRPGEFTMFDASRFHFVVVAGRRPDLKRRTYRIRREMKKDNRRLILHYDNLVDGAENVIGRATY